MKDIKIPRPFGVDDKELEELIDKRMKSWRALREQDGTHSGTVHSIANSYERMKRQYENQHAIVGHLVQRIEDMGKELAELRKKND